VHGAGPTHGVVAAVAVCPDGTLLASAIRTFFKPIFAHALRYVPRRVILRGERGNLLRGEYCAVNTQIIVFSLLEKKFSLVDIDPCIVAGTGKIHLGYSIDIQQESTARLTLDRKCNVYPCLFVDFNGLNTVGYVWPGVNLKYALPATISLEQCME
tara:strand:- start:2227 stop:2694 length:468 start_codon:yes stop_codon:yes gene_type:complete